ncbi:unnamed protein product [Rotaria magnacalcarata]|uniref:Uncharacterized protein n=1 Tax=Rotaria magnacalcarata TaxID=392030 RepID=A0A820RPB6_9BILA|nr:unnamed protein product [Rotaria magnacalcarata]
MSRLKLLDHRFILTQDIRLYEFYLNESQQHNMYPEDVIDLVETNENESIETWLHTKLAALQQNLEQCSTNLVSQSLSCPKAFSLEYVDTRLQ